MTNLLGRLLGTEGADQITQYDLSLAAPWASDGPAWLLFGCAGLVFVAIVFYVRFQQRGHARTRFVLTLLRATALSLLLLILAEPILTVSITGQKRPTLWLLFDGTDSMAIRDRFSDTDRAKLASACGVEDQSGEVGNSGGSADLELSRIDYVKHLLRKEDDNLLVALAKKARLQAFLFDSADGVRSLELSPDGGGVDGTDVDGEHLGRQLTTNGKVSAIGTALDDLARRHATSNLGGLLIFSDFDQNSGKSAKEAARRLDTKIYTVGVGATDAIDVAVSIQAPMIMKKDERSEVTVILRQRGLEGEQVRVTVTARRLDAAQDAQDDVVIPVGEEDVTLSGPSSEQSFSYVPETTGRFAFQVEVEPVVGEAVHENNQAQREVAVRDDFLRVLYVEYEPSWEWRFVKEVFHRDQLVGMEGFRTYLRSSDARVRDSNAMFLKSLTPSRKEFFANDVIFLGDLPATVLSPRFCEMTEEFVRNFGGGLVVVSGPRYGPGQLAGTEIERMLPVRFDPDLVGSPGDRIEDGRPFRLALTPLAGQFDFMRLGADEEESREAWDNLGPLPWYQPVSGLHSQAVVLAEHPTHLCQKQRDGSSAASEGFLSGNESEADDAGSAAATRQPLIAIRKYGAGEVIYLGFNETWRLRRKYGERYYRQFWGQMIHRLGLSHAIGSQKRFVVRTDRRGYQVDDRVRVTVEAYDEQFQPLTESGLRDTVAGVARLRVRYDNARSVATPATDAGATQLHGELILPSRDANAGDNVQPLSIAMVRAGVFETEFPVFTDGEHFVRVTDPITGEPVEVTFKVTSVSVERHSAVRDVALQERIAAVNPGGATGGGGSFDLTEISGLAERIELTPRLETTRRIIPLWSTWLCFACVVGLLLGEWLLRKWVNLQ
ncbi:MAG: hypothetical protein V3R99_10990 [Thermoguttaceae bacterium]